eukprot:maker-scaffold_19-snap-gene-2.42-mRNA-1 protein AED:0.01 eAED:0.03 QI:0/0/0/1/1/1/3/0/1057
MVKHDNSPGTSIEALPEPMATIESESKILNKSEISTNIKAVKKIEQDSAAKSERVAEEPAQKKAKILNSDINTKDNEPLAKNYPFELDPFQKQSIELLEQRHSVLVAAHTSAGKTAVAEYAIAMALRDNQRVIYTSPIKALSNQKYRELEEEFSDVGLLTGDVTINPNASCLVMTTEILRSMLYRGSEIIRSVQWAIFDEVHYMRDKTRGVVWEESIILLPHKVRYVFLSATIPNGQQFADWVCKIHSPLKEKPMVCEVVYTDYRPTPLQHFMYVTGDNGVHLIVDEKGNFLENNLSKAMGILSRSNLKEQMNGKKKRNQKQENKTIGLVNLIKMVVKKNFDPCIVFSFSKKDCEGFAKAISTFELNTAEESEIVHQIYKNAISSLNESDSNLPQINSMLPLLKRGIGIHHGGLLPILKEIVEILFGEGLIKVLFATETFAMGVNMPAKTVIFTSIRKWDGSEVRWVSSGEYIQMSGRAGRRGKDTRGIVVQMVEEIIEPDVAKRIMSGSASPLTSSFYLGYNMLLNLMRIQNLSHVEGDGTVDAEIEYMIRNSLFSFQNSAALPVLEEKIKLKEEELSLLKLDEDLEMKFQVHKSLLNKLKKAKDEKRVYLMQEKFVKPFLVLGRLVKVHKDKKGLFLGIVERRIDILDGEDKVDVLLLCKTENDNFGDSYKKKIKIMLKKLRSRQKLTVHEKKYITKLESENLVDLKNSDDEEYVLKIVRMKISQLEDISEIKVQKTSKTTHEFKVVMDKLLEKFPADIPLLNPINDFGVEETKLKDLNNKIFSMEKELEKDPIEILISKNKEETEEQAEIFLSRENIRKEISSLNLEKGNLENLPLKERLSSMKKVLRNLEFVDNDNVVQIKGRVACEISSGHELIITEMLFSGKFSDELLDPALVASMLSCLIYTDRGEDEVQLPKDLNDLFQKVKSTAKIIAETETEAGMDPIMVENTFSTEKKSEEDAEKLDKIQDFVDQFKPDIMELVYLWCKGKKFSEVIQVTDAFEGSVIRCMRRLAELLRQLCVAAKVIGDQKLEGTFKQAIALIKRDIIFAGSLYL